LRCVPPAVPPPVEYRLGKVVRCQCLAFLLPLFPSPCCVISPIDLPGGPPLLLFSDMVPSLPAALAVLLFFPPCDHLSISVAPLGFHHCAVLFSGDRLKLFLQGFPSCFFLFPPTRIFPPFLRVPYVSDVTLWKTPQ